MNLYFLVEGKRTEKKVYPCWLSVLLPEYKQLSYAFEVNQNNYYLFSGDGFPSLLHHLENAIAEINDIGCFDYLILCLDADEVTVQERIQEIQVYLQEKNVKLNQAALKIIVQNRCFETWFLGNRKVYQRQPQSEILKKYQDHFNVQQNDPEEMQVLSKFETIAQFHESYLKQMLAERGIRYSKNNPNDVKEAHYLQELIKRNQETGHIASFGDFIQFIDQVQRTD